MEEVLRIENLSLNLNTFSLKDINLSVNSGEIIALLGENGSGKTTLLNTVAGFFIPTSGKIFLNGVDITTFPPYKREIGYIFQNLALFPHLTVEENIKFGLRFKKIENGNEKFKELIKFFRIEHLLKRYPYNLSGGEKQKVALARTLILDPSLILLDEPTSQLSPREKDLVSQEIRDIITRFKKSAIYVTHSVEEAHIVSDRIAIIENGAILQIGKPTEIFFKPINESVARIGEMNVFEGIVVDKNDELCTVKVDNVNIHVLGDFLNGDRVKIFIRPEEIFISDEETKTSARNYFKGEIKKITHRGVLSKVSIKVNGLMFDALITRKSLEELGLELNKTVFLSFKATSIHVLKIN